jgi:XFP-like protein
MTLQPSSEHPHGLSDREFDSMFGVDKPIIFAYHGYPWLIHRLTYRRAAHNNLHVRGFKERWCSLRESERIRPKCAPRLAAIWNFLASNSMRRPTRGFLLMGTSAPRIPESVPW